jgi:hypothetical protein
LSKLADSELSLYDIIDDSERPGGIENPIVFLSKLVIAALTLLAQSVGIAFAPPSGVISNIVWRRILRINWRELPRETGHLARLHRWRGRHPGLSVERSLLASATCSAAALAASKLSAVPLETKSGRAFFPLCL